MTAALTIWLYLLLGLVYWKGPGGGYIKAGGVYIKCEDCPCEDELIPETCTKCDTGSERNYQTVDFEGVVNHGDEGTCEDCDDWNTTAWEVPQILGSGGCSWFLDEGLPCGALELEVRISNAGGPAQNTRVIVEVLDESAFLFRGAAFDETRLNTAHGNDGKIDCANIGAVAWSLQANSYCDWTAATVNVTGHN